MLKRKGDNPIEKVKAEIEHTPNSDWLQAAVAFELRVFMISLSLEEFVQFVTEKSQDNPSAARLPLRPSLPRNEAPVRCSPWEASAGLEGANHDLDD